MAGRKEHKNNLHTYWENVKFLFSWILIQMNSIFFCDILALIIIWQKCTFWALGKLWITLISSYFIQQVLLGEMRFYCRSFTWKNTFMFKEKKGEGICLLTKLMTAVQFNHILLRGSLTFFVCLKILVKIVWGQVSVQCRQKT